MIKGGLGGLMKQAQVMQENMKKAQEQLAQLEVEGQAGAGMVKVTQEMPTPQALLPLPVLLVAPVPAGYLMPGEAQAVPPDASTQSAHRLAAAGRYADATGSSGSRHTRPGPATAQHDPH